MRDRIKSIRGHVLVFIVCCAVPIAVLSQEQKTPTVLHLDQAFYNEFNKTHGVLRDDFFESRLNSIVHCRGTVFSLSDRGRYRKKYRVVLHDDDADKSHLVLIYNVFFENKETYSMLSKDDLFDCEGQLMSYTPLNVKRNSYMLDIVLEKGSIVLDR